MKVGDLVKMTRELTGTGLLLELIRWDHPKDPKRPRAWARILWSDDGLGIEKVRDIEVINESG